MSIHLHIVSRVNVVFINFFFLIHGVVIIFLMLVILKKINAKRSQICSSLWNWCCSCLWYTSLDLQLGKTTIIQKSQFWNACSIVLKKVLWKNDVTIIKKYLSLLFSNNVEMCRTEIFWNFFSSCLSYFCRMATMIQISHFITKKLQNFVMK